MDEFLNAVAANSPAAPAFGFAVGVITSAGPCLGPRIATIAGLTANARGAQRALVVAAFIGGLALSYALIAGSAALLLRVTALSTWLYTALAALLVWCGMRMLIDDGMKCAHRAASQRPPYGSALLSGVSFAFVASPCCTPIVASIAGIAALSDAHWFGLTVAIGFALGHAAPLAVASICAVRIRALMHANSWQLPVSVVGGSVMLALGGYYALLA